MYEFELQERQAEDAGARRYHELYHTSPISRYWDEDLFRFVAATCAEGDRILDVGCGPGSHWRLWRRLSASRLAGVDLSRCMIEEARRLHPDGEFHVGRIHDLPFPDGSFDVVIASAVLHHIPDEHLAAAIDELARVLDEHGRIVGREPSDGGFGQQPGWLSGAIMGFRHLAFRVTRSREYPEPALGDNHHVPATDFLLASLSRHFHVGPVVQRFPFSAYLYRVRSQRVADLAHYVDDRLHDRRGTMFCYVGEKNFTTSSDIAAAVENALADCEPMTDAEFLATLQAAAERLEAFFPGAVEGHANGR